MSAEEEMLERLYPAPRKRLGAPSADANEFRTTIHFLYLDREGRQRLGIWQSTEPVEHLTDQPRMFRRSVEDYFRSLGYELLSMQLMVAVADELDIDELLGRRSDNEKGALVMPLFGKGPV